MKEIKIDIKEILKTLPHRYPFLLVDRIIELEEGKRAVGIKNVTMNEPHFQGHFPDYPVMPGVLIVESMAQVGAIMALRLPESEGKLVFFAGIDNARFRKPVIPGDQLRIEVEVLWVKSSIGKMKAKSSVDDQLVAEGDLMFSLVPKEEGGAKIHPTATVHPTAHLGNNVEIGPYTTIGPEVSIGDGTVIHSHCIISKWTSIGKENCIHHGTTIGAPPQDYRYKGEKNKVVIGDRNMIREFVTIHLPTGEGAETRIGDDNFIMVHAHIPHNCKVGNQTVIGGYVGIGGHTIIEDHAVIGGLAGIHQHCRIGKLAMIGAQTKIVQDIPPFMLVDGNPAQMRGVNTIGLERRGIPSSSQVEIKKAFKILYQSKMNLSQATSEIKKKLKQTDEIRHLASFLEESTKRGVSKKIAEGAEFEEKMILPEVPEIGI